MLLIEYRMKINVDQVHSDDELYGIISVISCEFISPTSVIKKTGHCHVISATTWTYIIELDKLSLHFNGSILITSSWCVWMLWRNQNVHTYKAVMLNAIFIYWTYLTTVQAFHN